MGEILRCKERKLFQDAIQRCLDISGGLGLANCRRSLQPRKRPQTAPVAAAQRMPCRRSLVAGVAGVIGLSLGEAVGSAHGWGHRCRILRRFAKNPHTSGSLLTNTLFYCVAQGRQPASPVAKNPRQNPPARLYESVAAAWAHAVQGKPSVLTHP